MTKIVSEDKKSVETVKDYQVEWKIDMPGGEEDVFMNLWMKAAEGREVFSIKSPPNKAFRGNHGLPYDVSKEPYLTFTARQHGEAWEHPFVSIYEPYTSDGGKSIKEIASFEDENGSKEFVGVTISHKSGRIDKVLSSKNGHLAKHNNIRSDASYAMIGNEDNGNFILFMGNGKTLAANGYQITTEEVGNVVLNYQDGSLKLHNEVAVTISFENSEKHFKAGELRTIEL